MQIYIDENTLSKIKKIIDLRTEFSRITGAKTDEEITRVFQIRDEIEELERQLGMDMIWAVAGKMAAEQAKAG